ncbi:MAG: TIGR00725 family protein [Deltaproteobacteria bacterium]|nr:TIGR00725 family protein [Deltaproteobacteria bacterium]
MKPHPDQKRYLAVIGAGNASPQLYQMALSVGRFAARKGWVVVTGGLGGVMEAAARGAKEAGGTTLGILPGGDRKEANPYLDISVVTHIRHARNSIIAHTADALIAVDGEYGTLSEIALGLKLGKPVIGLATLWEIPGLVRAESPEEAIEQASSLMDGEDESQDR